jgi:hypothetical protein
MARDHEPEHAAAQMVVRVVGGEYVINDTGAEDAQYDVRITTEARVGIALEVTSVGGDDWRRTKARIAKERERGRLEGANLRWVWWVIFPTGTGVRDMPAQLEPLLERLESHGVRHINNAYVGTDDFLEAASQQLREMRINSLTVWMDEAEVGQPRVILSQSERRIGTDGALASAIAQVFAKGDNQKKLADVECDERHLYILMEDGGGGSVLEGAWELSPRPVDPEDVIDTVWIFSPSASSYLFRVTPGADDWTRYSSITGEAL